jgi:hypothetical protein
MRIDSAGNVGIGTSSPARKLHVSGTENVILRLDTTDSANYIQLGNSAGTAYVASVANAVVLATGTGGTERMRIDSDGNLLVGTTSMGNTHAYFEVSSVDRRILNLGSSTTASAGVLQFRNPNGVVGVVATSGSSTSYLTSSDYRLKNTIAPMIGALDKVALLKPVTYKWNVDGSDGQGFIAHELQEVVEGCVTGAKDAVDADGNPQYQGIDTSFLVATLTAALQEAHGLIKDLQARVDALEAK